MIHQPVTEYKGFVIDRFNTIYKDGKEIFTHYTQYNYDLQHAKNRIDTSLAFKVLIDKQAALKKLTSSNIDYVEQEMDKLEDKMNNYYEQQNEL